MDLRLGCIHDGIGVHGSHSFEDLCGSIGPVYPEAIDMRWLLFGEPILNQGSTASCVRHGIARAIQLHARSQFDETYEMPSPRHLTAITKALLGEAWLPTGCTPGSVVEAIQGAGYCKDSLCPWAPELDGEIYLDQAEIALEERDLRAHRVVTSDQVGAIKQALAAGVGVGVGTDVDEPFLRWVGDDVWQMTGPRIGAHFMAAVGYRPGAILFVGSYGFGWAEDGCIWISEDQIASLARTRSIWVLDSVPRWIK